MNESDLFQPVKEYLEHQGYSVHAEVKNCDIAARKGDDLIIVELKKAVTLKLLSQAVRRKEITESVYVAVPVFDNKPYPGSNSGVILLLRRLEIGLILIRSLKTKTKIEIALHPVPHSVRYKRKKKRAILREIDGRYAEFNKAGEPSAQEKIFAYKQESLRIAAYLAVRNTMSPKELREKGCSVKTQQILSRNVYGWFDRVERGIYRLHPAGKEALARYDDVIKMIKESAAYRRS